MRLFPGYPKTANEKYVEKELVEMRPSSIPGAGTGVFAKKDIPNNTELGIYRGEYLTNSEFHNRYDDSGLGTYVLTIDDLDGSDKKSYVDGIKKGNWITLINSPKGTLNKVNVIFYSDGKALAKRNIKAGEELFVGYGSKYWNNRYWKNTGTRKVKKH